MNPQTLDILARGVLNMLGLDPRLMRQNQRLQSSRDANKKPIKAGNQTELLNKAGKARDFRNPKVSANRPATTSPLSIRSGAQPTPPTPPAGGFGQASGQMSLFGTKPGSTVPNTQFRAPTVPASVASQGGRALLGRVLGPAALLLQGIGTAKSLSDSLARGEGFARIPSLLGINKVDEQASFQGPGGDPSGSGKGQAQQRASTPETTPTTQETAPPTPRLPPAPATNRQQMRPTRSSTTPTRSTPARSTSSQPRNAGAGNGAPRPTSQQSTSKRKFGVKGGKNKAGRTERLESALKSARTTKYKRKR